MRTTGIVLAVCLLLGIVAGCGIGGPSPAAPAASVGETGMRSGNPAAEPAGGLPGEGMEGEAGEPAVPEPGNGGQDGEPKQGSDEADAGESEKDADEPAGGKSGKGPDGPAGEEPATDGETPDGGEGTPPPFEKKYRLPDGFVYVDDHVPGVLLDIRYFGENNFVGAPIDGYNAPWAILAEEAADALAGVQEEVQTLGYTLLIYDAYRPQKAVEHFKAWSQNPDDVKTKADYYPDLEKNRLFKLGYIASRSGHSRGSTVDLTLADAATGEPLDMGGPYDFFGEVSHHGTPLITEEQAANRRILKEAMERHGFKAYAKEWWHYTLRNEPYPDTYFDFDVE